MKSFGSAGHPGSKSWLDRRGFVLGAGAVGMALGAAGGTAYTQIASRADHSLRIAPLRLELAPGKVIDTFAYNGTVPGPALRLREGSPVSIDIRNDTDVDDIVHWHGLYLPSQSDGAMEEGSPMVARGGMQRYGFVAKPAGTRWYHSHNMAGPDLRRSLYAGLYGFLLVEPPSDPGRYDQEVLLAAHHWEGSWVSMQDIRRGPPPDNGLEVMYASASFNDKMLGPRRAGACARRSARAVPPAQRQPDGECQAGAAWPSPRGDRARRQSRAFAARRRHAVPGARGTGRRDRGDEPARRLDFGEVSDDERKKGLGIVVEYAGQRGEPQWTAPPNSDWDYTLFGRNDRPVPAPDERVELMFEKVPGGRGGYNRWTINGRSWPSTNPLFSTERGKRYRLVMTNKSGDNHPVHLHRHTFEITKVGDKPTAGVMKDTVNMTRFSTVEIDFVADDPGLTLLHCHHQDHQDEGFMGMMTYL